MEEVVVELQGFNGGPGYNVFYFADGSANKPAALNNFYTQFAGRVPDDVTFVIPNSGKVLNPVDGSLTGTWSDTATTNVVGTNVGAYQAPAGGLIRWITTGIVANRIVKGRTFIVPLGSGTGDTDGTLAAAARTDLQAGADALLLPADSELQIWSRPKRDDQGSIIRSGSAHTVTAAQVPDYITVLRSRRD